MKEYFQKVFTGIFPQGTCLKFNNQNNQFCSCGNSMWSIGGYQGNIILGKRMAFTINCYFAIIFHCIQHLIDLMMMRLHNVFFRVFTFNELNTVWMHVNLFMLGLTLLNKLLENNNVPQ